MDTGSLLANRYRLEEPLGAGQRTQTYRATDTQNNDVVAVKVPVEPGNAAAAGEQIGAEIDALQRVRHPHIAALLDHGRDARGGWLAREYVEGGSLDEYPDAMYPGLAIFHRLATQSLDALAAAHEAGVLHGDLKPANLLLDERVPEGVAFEVKLIDFGLAVTAKAATSGRVAGSIHMLAPELIDGAPNSVRSDLYALGCTFFFALTRQPPFAGETVTDLLLAHASGERQRTEVPLSGAMNAWLERLMARDPAKRFASAAEAKAALP